MLEKEIERRLGLWLRSTGCLYLKFVSPGCTGVPDRIVICPDGRVYWVELKTEEGALSDRQKIVLKQLEAHGQSVHVVRGLEGAKAFVRMVKDGV